VTLKPNPLVNKAAAWPLLVEATKELVYLSESETPFAAVQDSIPRAEFEAKNAREQTGRGIQELVEKLSVSEFFSELTESQEWHGPAEKQTVNRYRALHRIFTEMLAASTVFKIGQIKVTILIVGRTSDGYWVGARTEAIET